MVNFLTVLVVFIAAVFSINHALAQSQKKDGSEGFQNNMNEVQGKEK